MSRLSDAKGHFRVHLERTLTDLCCSVRDSAPRCVRRSHDTGRTHSVVAIYTARGFERSVLTAHVPPPLLPEMQRARAPRRRGAYGRVPSTTGRGASRSQASRVRTEV